MFDAHTRQVNGTKMRWSVGHVEDACAILEYKQTDEDVNLVE